jgi:hypothetical protein
LVVAVVRGGGVAVEEEKSRERKNNQSKHCSAGLVFPFVWPFQRTKKESTHCGRNKDVSRGTQRRLSEKPSEIHSKLNNLVLFFLSIQKSLRGPWKAEG